MPKKKKNSNLILIIGILIIVAAAVIFLFNKNYLLSDISNNGAVFSYQKPSITLTSAAVETWQQGSTQNIKWTSAGVSSVKITLSTQPSHSIPTKVITIIQGAPASVGAYSFAVPTTLIPGTYVLMIFDAANSNTHSAGKTVTISGVAFGSCNISFVENSSLDGYLGPNIFSLKESDWMHNPDIINQVRALTNGKNNNMDKAIAIANWVKQSRPYDYAEDNGSGGGLTPANKLFSVIDIYKESTGVCLDAAIITSAMFRLANIPARLTFPTFGAFHAIAQGYINNQWITFDSTFGSGPAYVDVKDFPPFVVSYFDELENPDLYSQHPLQPGEYFGTHAYKQFNIANNDSVFGNITLADIPSNSKLYPSDSLFDAGNKIEFPVSFDITRTDNKDLYYAVYNNQMNYIFSSSQPPDFCIPGHSGGISTCTPYVKFFRNAILMMPNIVFLDGFNNYVPGSQVNSAVNPVYRYLKTVKLPLGSYKIIYYANLPMSIGNSNVGGKTNIASADFEVVQGGTVKLTSDKFSIITGANQTYFKDIIKRLSDTWTNCMNNPQI